jgi:hypothetical protein
MKDWIPFVAVPAVVTGSAIPGVANTYLTVEQAQKTIFPGASFTQFPVTLTPDQQKKIESRSKVGVRSRDLKVWKVSNGGWFLVDEVRASTWRGIFWGRRIASWKTHSISADSDTLGSWWYCQRFRGGRSRKHSASSEDQVWLSKCRR